MSHNLCWFILFSGKREMLSRNVSLSFRESQFLTDKSQSTCEDLSMHQVKHIPLNPICVCFRNRLYLRPICGIWEVWLQDMQSPFGTQFQMPKACWLLNPIPNETSFCKARWLSILHLHTWRNEVSGQKTRVGGQTIGWKKEEESKIIITIYFKTHLFALVLLHFWLWKKRLSHSLNRQW